MKSYGVLGLLEKARMRPRRISVCDIQVDMMALTEFVLVEGPEAGLIGDTPRVLQRCRVKVQRVHVLRSHGDAIFSSI